jgi:hypothetical protein
MANLANAQLMEPPEGSGPAFVGAVKQGTGIILDNPTGTVNANLNAFCSKVVAGIDVTILPGTGVGEVTISTNIQPQPSDYLPIGTQMTFFQTGAPPRWITESPGTRLLRINSSGGSQGGSEAWTSVFTTQTFSGSVSVNVPANGSTDTVNETPSGSVQVSGVSLGATSLSQGQLPSHAHTYQQRDSNGQRFQRGNQINNQTPAPTEAAGGNGGHSHSVSGGGGSFSGNNMSHSHSVSATVTGGGSFSGGSFDFNVQYIDMIVCRKLSNPF